MCGICGIVDFKQSQSKAKKSHWVQSMNNAIIHRGPDAEGIYNDEFCSLGMRRLSIIDLEGSQQPIYNEDRQLVIFFNGEIYNFQTLRKELLEKGHQFRTQGDTEVLVHGYEEWGEAMVEKLRGMFAFCIYDIAQQTVFLARDRFGEKPLYYHWQNGVFSFSSEVKSLLENASIPRVLNQEALPYYFRTSLVPEPLTLLKGVKSLAPGYHLKIKGDHFDLKQYYTIDYKVNSAIKTEEDAIAFIKPSLLKAVQRQMVSDVPLGAFLSGGIDSSTIVALLQKSSSQRIKTFTVRFEDQAYDESAIARKVAQRWNTDHHEVVIPNYDFDESIFWTIIDHVGLPFRDSSAIPSFLISQAIRKEVKVALSGDGGDELFGGYSVFQWYQKIIRFQGIPSPLRSLGDQGLKLAKQIPGIKQWSTLRQIHRAVGTSLQATDEIPIALNEMFKAEQMKALFGKEGSKAYPLLREYPSIAKEWTPLRQIMYYRMRHTLPANMLIKVDRMSMANSLEVRAPFLDPDLADVAGQLPDQFLVHKGTGKYIIRKIMEKDLPAEVFSHPKMGFSIPLHKYQNKVFKKLAERLLFEENPWPDFLSKKALETIYYRGLETTKSSAQMSVFQSAHQLWMLMQLLGWATRFKVQWKH